MSDSKPLINPTTVVIEGITYSIPEPVGKLLMELHAYIHTKDALIEQQLSYINQLRTGLNEARQR